MVAIVALAGVVFGYVTLRNDQAGDEATAKANDVIAQSERPFGQHYRGLGKA